jgi:hypothetical protein
MTKDQIEVMNLLTENPMNKTINVESVYNQYDRIYPFTTENIKEYMKDLNNKKILTVTGSGDHAIEAYLKGAKKVDTFDINLLAGYYQELKIAAIKYLSYEEFLFLFELEGSSIDYRLSLKIYSKIRNYISTNARDVFDYLFNNFVLDNNFLDNQLFFKTYTLDGLKNRVSYLDEQSFNETKKILKQKNTSFTNTPMNELPSVLFSKYDAIFLSNITSYTYRVDKVIRLLQLLKSYITEEGRIYFSYIYGDDEFELDPKYNSIQTVKSIEVDSVKNLSHKDKVYYIKK